ncbi:MAG: PD-(D/E)XK nuclease family protein [Thermoplasmatota archaeon]
MNGKEDYKKTDMDLAWIARGDTGMELVRRSMKGDLGDVEGSLVLFPSSRICHEAKLSRAVSGGGPSGALMTVTELSHRILERCGPGLPVMDLTFRDLLVLGIMERNGSENFAFGSEVRGPMAGAVSRAIGELIREGIGPERLRSSARTDRSRELADIYHSYLTELKERSVLDNDLAIEAARSALDSSDMRWRSFGSYMPGYLPGNQRKLIELAISRSDKVMVREHPSRRAPWIGSWEMKRPLTDPRPPPYGGALTSRLLSDKAFSAILGKDPLDCFRKVLREIKWRAVSQDMDISRCSIVLPFKKSYDDLIALAAEEYGVDVDQGQDLPLDRVPLVVSVMELVRSTQEGLPRSSVVGPLSSPFLSLKEVSGNPIGRQELEMITREARIISGRGGVEEGWLRPLDVLEEGDPDGGGARVSLPLKDLLKELVELAQGSRTADEHYRGIVDILRSLDLHSNLERTVKEGERSSGSPPGEGPYQFNVQGLRELYSAMGAISAASRNIGLGKMSLSRYLKILDIEIRKRRVRKRSRTHGVRVMGLEEAAGMKLDIVFLCGMVEGEMPPPDMGFRILTEGERSVLGLPPSNDSRRMLEDLSILMSSSEETVICSHRTSGDLPRAVSPFIEDLELEELPERDGVLSVKELQSMIGELSDPSYYIYGDRSLARTYSLPDLIESTGETSERIERSIASSRSRMGTEPDQYRGRLVQESSIRHIRSRFGPDHVWSVTQLETFRKCGYSFLARYVLGIVELEDLEPGIPPEKKGMIFHEVAERFYSERISVGSDRLTPDELPEAWEMMKRITGEVMSQYNYRGPFWDALRDQLLGSGRENGLLREFLEAEAAYQGPFRVSGTELSFGMGKGESPSPVSIFLHGDEQGPDSFLLRGAIDRVDVLRHHGGDLSFIWDYKTGSLGVDKDCLQVPLYLAAMRRIYPKEFPAGGGYYYVRRRGSITADPVLGRKVWEGLVSGKEELQQHIEKIQGTIASAVEESLGHIDTVRSGEMVPDPKCNIKDCPYEGMCRRGDRR